MKKLILMLLAALLLAGCSGPAPEPPGESAAESEQAAVPPPSAQGLYLYEAHRRSDAVVMEYYYMRRGPSDHGLVTRQGETVVPPGAYQILRPPVISHYGAYELTRPAEEQYYIMHPTLEDDNFWSTVEFSLVSPAGEVVAEDFYLILATEEPHRFVGIQSWDGRDRNIVWIDGNGTVTPCDDPALVEAARFMDYSSYTGDIAMSLPLEETDLSPPQQAFGEYAYPTVRRLGPDRYLYRDYIHETGEAVYHVMDAQGAALLDQVFDDFVTVFPYHLGVTGDEVTIVHMETLEALSMTTGVNPYPLVSINRSEASYYWSWPVGQAYQLTGENLVLASAQDDRQLTDLLTGERLDFSHLPQGSVWLGISEDGGALLFGWQDGEEPRYAVLRRDGAVLLESGRPLEILGNYILTCTALPGRGTGVVRGGPTIVWSGSIEMDFDLVLYGLLDLEGNRVLPMEFSLIEVMDQGLLRVIRGDYGGMMDDEGRWIRRESVYRHLLD